MTGSVSANTDILVCGAGVGAKKTDDAQKKGVEVWTEDQFTSALSIRLLEQIHQVLREESDPKARAERGRLRPATGTLPAHACPRDGGVAGRSGADRGL